MRQTEGTAAIDKHVSRRLRERRVLAGFTQQTLAERVGVTYQQEHKYEHAVDRISAGRLYLLAQALGVSVDYFFEGLDKAPLPAVRPHERRMLEIVKLFGTIDDPLLQEALANLARTLAEQKAADAR